jgi:hypothetical protein
VEQSYSLIREFPIYFETRSSLQRSQGPATWLSRTR